jgi:hypothetical protein
MRVAVQIESECGDLFEISGEVYPIEKGNRRGHPDTWEEDSGGEIDDASAIVLATGESMSFEQALEACGLSDAHADNLLRREAVRREHDDAGDYGSRAIEDRAERRSERE